MKQFLFLLFTLLLLFSSQTVVVASTDGNEDPYIKYLNDSITKLDNTINVKRNELYNLKIEWYETCVNYLNQNPALLKKSELKRLIEQTVENIDGKDLLTELRNAYECVNKGSVYHYQSIPRPIYTGVVLKNDTDKKNNQKKNVKDPSKSEEKKPVSIKNDKDNSPKETKVENDGEDSHDSDDKSLNEDKRTPNTKDKKKEESKKDNKVNQDSTRKKENKDVGSIEEGKSKSVKPKDGGQN